MARKYGFANCQPQVASQFIIQYSSFYYNFFSKRLKKTTDTLEAMKLFENVGCLK